MSGLPWLVGGAETTTGPRLQDSIPSCGSQGAELTDNLARSRHEFELFSLDHLMEALEIWRIC